MIVYDAKTFLVRLRQKQSDEELRKIQRYFKSDEGEYGHGDTFIGVRMGDVFALAREFIDMDLAEIERLLESDIHEARAGAMSIMAKQFALKGTTPERKQALFDLYLRRHDRINNWDLVDLAAWNVIGPHLLDRPRDVLYRLAKSANLWERRTAIYSTYAFIERGDYDDALTIAEMFVSDREDLIHKATGGMLRAIGDKGRERLIAFLEAHAATMPRVMLRYAIEKFTPEERKMWMAKGR